MFTPKVNVESKNHLARLLAVENLYIQHQNVPTASFDLTNRILTIPIWKDISGPLYNLFCGHEVSHALYSGTETVASIAKRIDPDPNNIGLAASYWNIVEDPRCERLIKSEYPGLRSDFAIGYQELFRRNFFGIQDVDVNQLSFIDRINLHFKVGDHLNLKFTPEEWVYVDKVLTTLSREDAIEVAIQIYQYCSREQPPQTKMPSGQGKDSDDSQGKDSKVADGKGSKGSKGTKLGSGKGKGTTSIIPPGSTTQAAFDAHVQSVIDFTALNREYVNIPKPNLKSIVVKSINVHEDLVAHFTEAQLNTARTEYENFRTANSSKIDYIVQQFELKKHADEYQRTLQHKTGSLDPLRLWAYRIDDDLFKTIEIVSNGKNHGLIFVVDWSGSMATSMAGTLEQLIVLCTFCRKAQIPFEVYSLTIHPSNSGIKSGIKSGAFEKLPGNLVFTKSFRMRCYLESSMTARQFNDACVNLFAMMPNGSWSMTSNIDGLTGCTPLIEAIATTEHLMNDFRLRTKAQIVNAIFLTDGGSNTVGEFVNANGVQCKMLDKLFIINDRVTHKTYEFNSYDMTQTMFRILRDRQDINVVGFYIDGDWKHFFPDADATQKKALAAKWKEDGYVIAEDWGYNELYITSDGERLRIKDDKLEIDLEIDPKNQPGSPEYAEALGKAFTKQCKTIKKSRMMLDRFVTMIA